MNAQPDLVGAIGAVVIILIFILCFLVVGIMIRMGEWRLRDVTIAGIVVFACGFLYIKGMEFISSPAAGVAPACAIFDQQANRCPKR